MPLEPLPTHSLHLMMAGAVVMGCLVVALLFLRSWRRTRDRLFLMFALAFAVLAVQRAIVADAVGSAEDAQAHFYILRLIAFLLILAAILDKNRASTPPSPGSK